MTPQKRAIVRKWLDRLNQHHANMRQPGLPPEDCDPTTEIDRTTLKNRTKSALYNAGISTVADLLCCSSHTLLRMKNCGAKSRQDIWLFCSAFLASHR